jgi:lipoprotein NlpD
VAAESVRPDSGAEPAEQVLVVSRGDTLWSIARRHGVAVDALAELNGLDAAEPLLPGQRLGLPAGSAAAPAAQWYTVRRGDSLSGIGRRFGVSVERLTRWNDLQTPDALRPGQRLQVARVGEAVHSDGAAGRSP